MADNEPVPTPTTPAPVSNQVNTTDLKVTPVAPAPSGQPDRLSPPKSTPGEGDKGDQAQKGAGVEGEETVWEGRYSMKNFVGRIIFRVLLTIGWIALATYTWGYDHREIIVVTVLTGLVLVLLWAALIYRIILARYGHYYRLTTRRLFVSTGLYRRRRDQVELIKVNDVYTEQKLLERWVGVGRVVVKSSEPSYPTSILAGVSDPKEVMNTVWHYARAERDGRSVMVDRV